MKKTLFKLIILAALALGVSGWAQEQKVERADKKFDRLEYINAIQLYENICKKGFHSLPMLQNLADAYYFNGELSKAHTWYELLFEEYKNEVNIAYYYRYAQSLKAVEQYAKADVVLEDFHRQVVEDRRGRLHAENKEYLTQIERNSGRYEMELANVNSDKSDFGSTVFENKLIFASSRDRAGITKNIHMWTGDPFTRLYQAEITEEGTLGKVKPFSRDIHSKFNESSPVFTKDGQTVYFTRNNYLEGVRGKDEKETTLLKIYRATLKDGKWTDITDLSINSDEYSTAHPALSPDGKWLYYASDRPGTIGQSDLYKVAILSSGSLGNPINLGEEINTEGRETFPFISAENELYFASDGRPGLGGLDLYVAKINEDGSFGEVQNLGAPANSSEDDFGYYIDSSTRLGYLSSNRKGGAGKDDIYSFLEIKKLDLVCKQTIQGSVYDAKNSSLKISGAQIAFFNDTYELIGKVFTNADGEYSYFSEELGCGKKIYIKAGKAEDDYLDVERHLNLPNSSSTQVVDFFLNKKIVEVKKGDDLFKVLKLSPIYFDLDKSEIRPDAAIELAKVVEVMEMYPNMKVDIRSHTDSRGNDDYNMKLSDRRAKSTLDWIVSQGIDTSRLTAKGYGESQLINRCKNGVKCSEEEHQENRRSEFIVLEL